MNSTRLSIIVPVHNGARYIQDSLASLLRQVVVGVEVIVIDDGSADATSAIITDGFARFIEAGFLKLHVQANEGVSAARNRGIDLASGRFLGFMDADDFVLEGYIGSLLEAIETRPDIVEFGFRTFTDSIDETGRSDTLYTNRCFGLHPAATVIDHVFGIARWYPWTRVFRASLFDDVRFPVGVRFSEDLMTVPYLYEKAGTILGLRKALYGYRLNPASATFNVRPDYVHNLHRFYQSIPRARERRHDYLRLAVAYAICSCQIKAGERTALPEDISADMRKLRYSAHVYRHVEARKVAMQLYPTTFKLMRRLMRAVREVA